MPAARTPGAAAAPSEIGDQGGNALDEKEGSAETELSQARMLLAVALCWLLVIFDGYDLIVYGTVQSALMSQTGWGLDRASAGTLGSLAFLGMLLGALFAGRLSDHWERRNTILACTALFSVFTVLCSFVPDPVWFGAFRLIAGLGLGGLMPSVTALAAELVPPRHRALTATVLMSGVPIGGSVAALLGMVLIPGFGWSSMFLMAAVALVVVLPVAWAVLPETLGARSAGSSVSAADGGFRQLLRPPYASASVLFALATLAALFTWYGLGIWLPNLMQTMGHDLGSALTFALALNLGAVAGSLISATAGDRCGPAWIGAITSALAALALLMLLFNPPTAVVYGLFILAGIGTHGTQCLILAAIANRYPGPLRGTALGWALGVGRIGAAAPQVGGWMLAAGLGVNANFLVFAIAAALAALGLSAIATRSGLIPALG